jgi:maltooligosyltrehalose synthase
LPTKTVNSWYNKAIAKWAAILSDEIESMLPQLKKYIKSGEMQDALDELRRVLILANHDDLAEEAYTVKRLIDDVASAMLVREGYYYTAVNLEGIKERIRELIGKIKDRLGEAD